MASLTNHVIEYLEKCTIFDERYSNLKCINIDKTGEKDRQGAFSIIFKADDIIMDEQVIIKFYDPANNSIYRQLCFERESSILTTLLNKKRCLQLKKALKDIIITINIGNNNVELRLKYFVTEYLPISIIDSFYNKTNVSIIDKLFLYKDIVLSVRALHSHEVYHRDLKPDNLRGYIDNLKRIVVAIDLGTAIKEETPELQLAYISNVGHRGYSSPEAFVGFAGDRKLCFLTDFYALGCMLYELFNQDFFFIRMERDKYLTFLSYLRNTISSTPEHLKQQKWKELLTKYSHIIQYPDFSEFGSDIPTVIQDYLNNIFHGLISFNYNIRLTDFDYILHTIDTCITILRNETYQKEKLKRRKEYSARHKSNMEAIRIKHCSCKSEVEHD